MLTKAIAFAANKHEGAKRKGGDTPYIAHPAEALSIAATMTSDEEVLAAAVLHDTIEDTDTTPEEIKELFGERVLELVLSATENKRPELPASKTWRLRKEEALGKLKEGGINEKIIALSDKLSNIRSIYRDQIVYGEAVWQRFNNKNKADHRYYYEQTALCLKDLSSEFAYKEFVWYIDSVFYVSENNP